MASSQQGGPGPVRRFTAPSLDVVDFAGARVSELRALRAASASVSGNRRVYQQLSWHQRRRTMSHTSHRMPARLRAAHRRELAQAAGPDAPRAADGTLVERPPGPQGKMRCRKYRRRVGFLLALRRLRAASPRWLETHVWHAKRFRMEEVPGGRIVAVAPNDRGLRSGYRAVAHASLVHDASYLDVVEVAAASRGAIVAALSRCMSKEDAARSSVDPVVTGIRRVQQVVVRSSDGDAIAPVDLLWRPDFGASGVKQVKTEPQLWLWCHPVASAAVAKALSMQPGVDADNGNGSHGEAPNPLQVSATIMDSSTGLLMFSLIGPRAGAILGAVLHRVRSPGAEWECVRSIRSAGSLPRGCVLAMDVEDPRASFPPRRTGEGGSLTKPTGATLSALTDGFRTVGDSDLWSVDSRRAACSRAHHKDGTPWGDVPVICLQRTSSTDDAKESAFASGWDIVVPAGWGMAFWVSLMYANGARAAGQRELRHIALETGVSIFPDDYQDTQGGRLLMESLAKRAEERHMRKPPAKRINYTKYRIASPFRVDLSALVQPFESGNVAPMAHGTRRPKKRQRANAEEENAPISTAPLPRPRILRSMSEVCSALRLSRPPARGHRRFVFAPPALDAMSSMPPASWLLHILVRPVGRGVPRRNAEIVLPRETELKALLASGSKNPSSPVIERRGSVRPVVGTVLYGDYALSRGGALGSAVVSARAFLQAEPVWGGKGCSRGAGEDGRSPKGLRQNELVIATAHVLFRNVDSLHFRWAFADVVAS